jgi:hypothetical protein
MGLAAAAAITEKTVAPATLEALKARIEALRAMAIDPKAGGAFRNVSTGVGSTMNRKLDVGKC